MKKIELIIPPGTCWQCIVCCFLPAYALEEPAADSGRRLFEKHCAVCHPKGGNVVNPNKTLRKKHLAANGLSIRRTRLVSYMQNPGPGHAAAGA